MTRAGPSSKTRPTCPCARVPAAWGARCALIVCTSLSLNPHVTVSLTLRPTRATMPAMHSHDDIGAYGVHLQAAGRPRSTVYLRTWQLRRLDAELPGRLRAATTAELASYLARQDWQARTVYSVRATMRDFYRFLGATGRARRNPAAGLPSVRLPHTEPRPAPDAVIAAARGSEQVRLMIDLAARQGLRRCEIAAVHSRDLVEDSLGWSLIIHGKGRRERTVPLLPDVARRLQALPRGWAFPSPRGGHLTPNHVGILVSRALPQGWTAHSLRRRFATTVYRGSRDIRAVQMLLGHSSVQTTQVYVGVERAELRDALGHAA